MSKLERAYALMRDLMRHEYEFPDACFAAAMRLRVPYKELSDYYDAQTGASV
jgi:hypothetical protein